MILKNKVIIVTGGSGYIGQAITKEVIAFLRFIDSLTMRKRNEEIQKQSKRRDLKSQGPKGKQGISVNG